MNETLVRYLLCFSLLLAGCQSPRAKATATPQGPVTPTPQARELLTSDSPFGEPNDGEDSPFAEVASRSPSPFSDQKTFTPPKPVARAEAPPPPKVKERKPAPLPAQKPKNIERKAAPVPVPVPGSFLPPDSNLALSLPGPARSSGEGDARLGNLLREARNYPSGVAWRRLADRAVELEDFSTAAMAYSEEAKIYRETGDIQAAIVEDGKASQYRTELQLYRTVDASEPAKLERLEPSAGCYLGAFIDRDSRLRQRMLDSQVYGDVEQFNELVKKPHASFFMYRSYGQPFPTKWARYLKSNGAIVNIAWEPHDLSEITSDSRYLRNFVDSAKRLDHPVVLRFASEMNGAWTAYNGDPEAYKKAFRTVHQATRSAPKVALLWCPNAVPVKDIDAYYPGDDYVDWVGVNFYSVPFLDNDVKRSGARIHPTEHLKYVYDKYSARKPIAIGEWAASQQSSASEADFLPFGTNKMAQLYSSLPTRFPRVKMVNWYDKNNIKAEAKVDRRLNNYQLTEPREMLESYQRSIASDYFIGSDMKPSRFVYKPLSSPAALSPDDAVRVFLKSYDPELKVYFKADGRIIHASSDPSAWYLTATQLRSLSKPVVTVLVYDSQDRFVTKTKFKFSL